MTAESADHPPNLISRDTAEVLKAIARSKAARENSQLSLPEINSVADAVSQVAPAGNVPSLILNGLTRLPGRRLPPEIVKQDISLLFQGVERARDSAMYGALFAGPAAIIWAYQNLLKLAGKDPSASFPDGVWQFYVEYAMREDTARHANETRGFDLAMRQRQISLSPAERATAWVLAAAQCLTQYNALLENEWRERTALALLWSVCRDLPNGPQYANLYRQWEVQRPYTWNNAEGAKSYVEYRRIHFNAFLEAAITDVPPEARQRWLTALRASEERELPAYQRQMSILSCLDPSLYNETRKPLTIQQTHIGLIKHGRYYLIPVCAPGSELLASVMTVRVQVAQAFDNPPPAAPAPSLIALAEVKRAEWPKLRQKFNSALLSELEALRTAPILLNCDPRPRALPLAQLRLAERGIGDHALTVFDTGESFVFDQSHIYFDGIWGAAFAEIMTNEATAWGVYLAEHSERTSAIRKAIVALGRPVPRPRVPAPRMLKFRLQAAERKAVQTAPHRSAEATAETEEVNLSAIVAQRKLLEKRNQQLQLTVNDFLVLYRALHALTYRVAPQILAELIELSKRPSYRSAVKATLDSLDPKLQSNPAMLIPVDASQHAPRDRLHPLNFEVPLSEIPLLKLHTETLHALRAYQNGHGDRVALFKKFDKLQRDYLGMLAAFGEVMRRAKDITLRGENATVGSVRLLAHIPAGLQRFLRQIPGQFDLLNDLIQGREVFSNVGAVAPTSSLARFITAKDDHSKKMLAWGIMTDAGGVMRITLRDFRPHVTLLSDLSQTDLAQRITQDYLDTYAHGLNQYIRDLRHVVITAQNPRALAPRAAK
jgi:hypothetical protein